jgi:hypothetical protein
MMNDILCEFLPKFVTVYLDVICVYNRTLEEYLEHFRVVLQRFKEEGLKLRLKECFFGFKIWGTWATMWLLVKIPFRLRKSRPLHIGQCIRRKRRLVLLLDSATSKPSPSTILTTFRLH